MTRFCYKLNICDQFMEYLLISIIIDRLGNMLGNSGKRCENSLSISLKILQYIFTMKYFKKSLKI